MNELTRDDLRDVREDLRQYMREGFTGINARLDVIDDRTRQNELDIARIQSAAPAPPERPPIYKQPITYAVSGIGAAVAMIVREFLSAIAGRQ